MKYMLLVIIKGTGPASLVSEATTVNILPAQLPQYKLLNTSNGEGNYQIISIMFTTEIMELQKS